MEDTISPAQKVLEQVLAGLGLVGSVAAVGVIVVAKWSGEI